MKGGPCGPPNPRSRPRPKFTTRRLNEGRSLRTAERVGSIRARVRSTRLNEGRSLRTAEPVAKSTVAPPGNSLNEGRSLRTAEHTRRYRQRPEAQASLNEGRSLRTAEPGLEPLGTFVNLPPQ